jgi:glycosyltransferase involved in cell wall biosynthesis
MDNVSHPLRQLGLRALFLVWGAPRGTRRSLFMAQFLGMDIEYVYITARQGMGYALLKYPVQAFKTLLILMRKRPQVVFVQNPPILGVLEVYLWSLFTGARFIIDSHTDALLAPWWAWSLPLHRFLSRRAIATIVTNDHLWQAPAFVLTDVPILIAEQSPARLEPMAFNVAVVSTASYDEPLSEILAAASQIPEVAFHVTGNYRTRPDIVAQAPHNVHFTGYIPDGEFYGLLKAAQVVMCLTTEDHTIQSGAGEALWLGKPIITSDWPILRQYFSRGTIHVNNTSAEILQAIVSMRGSLATFETAVDALRQERWRLWQDKVSQLVVMIERGIRDRG